MSYMVKLSVLICVSLLLTSCSTTVEPSSPTIQSSTINPIISTSEISSQDETLSPTTTELSSPAIQSSTIKPIVSALETPSQETQKKYVEISDNYISSVLEEIKTKRNIEYDISTATVTSISYNNKVWNIKYSMKWKNKVNGNTLEGFIIIQLDSNGAYIGYDQSK